jgi:hypothetical protein
MLNVIIILGSYSLNDIFKALEIVKGIKKLNYINALNMLLPVESNDQFEYLTL